MADESDDTTDTPWDAALAMVGGTKRRGHRGGVQASDGAVNAASKPTPVHGLDAVGAADTGHALVVKLRDLQGTVAKQGGAAGAAAFALAPATVAGHAYEVMKTQMADGFRQKGVDVDISVVTTAPNTPAPPGELLTGIGIGVVGSGALYGVWKLISHLLRRR